MKVRLRLKRLRRVIREALKRNIQAPHTLSGGLGFSPMMSRADPEFARLIRGALNEEEAPGKEEDVDFDPAKAGKKLPKPLELLLDPEISPQKFFKFDQQMDARGSVVQQAQAIAAFALTYGDNEKDAKAILQKAIQELPKIAPAEGQEEAEG